MVSIVAYFRVSSDKQGERGLGMQAQQNAVDAYAEREGAHIIARFTEVESGRRNDRPQLEKALARAKRKKARLLVARLDRLGRDAHFLLSILKRGVDVAFCDLPQLPAGPTGRLVLTTMASIAEWEAGIISERTKAALQAYKAQGGLLGSARPGHWDGREHLRKAGLAKAVLAATAQRRAKAQEVYADVIDRMQALRRAGKSYREIARTLNEEQRQEGQPSHGPSMNPMTVLRVLRRAEEGANAAK
jgi:DNA invertase Pin-like site-specific DNA recombinase